MKVKKLAVKLDAWKMQTCRKRNEADAKGCRTEVELTERDLQMFHWFGTHFQHDYPGYRCPACGKINQVDLGTVGWQKFNTEKRRAASIFDGYSQDADR
jgi:hypothetical protein